MSFWSQFLKSVSECIGSRGLGADGLKHAWDRTVFRPGCVSGKPGVPLWTGAL